MRRVVEVLRLRFDHRLSQREIAQSVGVAVGSVNGYLGRFAASGLPWPLPPDVDEAALEARLFTDARPSVTSVTSVRPQPDWPTVRQELARKGVTLQLLWREYKRAYPEGSLVQAHSLDAAVLYRSLPIASHRRARPAAYAANDTCVSNVLGEA